MTSSASTLAEPAAPPAGVDRFRLGLLAVGHAVTDSYSQSLLSPLLPLLAVRLDLTLEMVGALPFVMGLTASLAQPLLGVVSDRRPHWCFVGLGPLCAALFIGFIGHAQSFWQLAALLLLAGLGIGSFHPQGALLARDAGRGGGLAMSAFTVGGNVGFGMAPILGTLYVAWFGLERLYLAALPAVLFSLVMHHIFRRWHPAAAPESDRPRVTRRAGRANLVALWALTGTVVMRASVATGIITFLPFLVVQRFPEVQQEAMKALGVSAFLLMSAVAGPFGGFLSDRIGRRQLMIWSFLLAPWPMLLALSQSGPGLVLLLAAGAFVLMLPHPGNVVMAQELWPERPGIAASMITGLAAGIALLLGIPLGYLAEQTSIGLALSGLCLFPLLGILLVLPIPERPHTE